MVVVQLRHLRHALVSEQQVINLKAELLQKTALKYSIRQATLINLAKVIEHYILYGLVVHQNLRILVLHYLLQLNVLDLDIGC